MSEACVAAAAAVSAFSPTGKAWLLRERYVPLDEFLGGRYEARAIQRLARADGGTGGRSPS